MSGLTDPERMVLGMIEKTEAFTAVDHNVVASQSVALAERFKGVSHVTLARFLLTAAVGLEKALMFSDDPEIQVVSVKAYCVELQIMAAAISRKERGLPPLGVNGQKDADDG